MLTCWRSSGFPQVWSEGSLQLMFSLSLSSYTCLSHWLIYEILKKSLKTPGLFIPVHLKQEDGLNLNISQYYLYNIHSTLCSSLEKSPRLFIIFCYLLVMFLLLKFEFPLTWQSFLNNHHFSPQLLTSYCHHVENSCLVSHIGQM